MSPYVQASWAPGSRFGPYAVLAPLGRGGMAEVVRARTLDGPWAGQVVALKRLLPALAQVPEYLQQFAKEADLATSLHHPHIVQTLEVGMMEGVSFLAMEWVDGRDLAQILQRCRQRKIPLPADFAVYLTRVLLGALEFAHGAQGPSSAPLGLVHCDVSPSNVFISRTGEVKLGDFGVARVRVRSGVRDSVVAGKPYYLSPEVLAGEVTQDADLWAAGVVLFELLTLRRPFTGTAPAAVFDAIRSLSRPSLAGLRPGISPKLEAVVERAFAPDPGQRFFSAAEFADALEPLYDERIGTPLAIAAVVRGLFGSVEKG